MFLIVGLGNPGREYEATRHNVGFMVLDWLAHRHQAQFEQGVSAFLIAKITLASHEICLLKPQTFMNRSGIAVENVRDYFQIEPSEMLIIYDDFNLPFGTLRLRRAGGAGGHNGLSSVIDYLQTEKLARLRIGIRNDDFTQNAADFVLSDFSAAEQDKLPLIIEQSARAAESFVSDGIVQSMNVYNKNLLLETQ